MLSRGIRNNNPGNIERNSTNWLGMAKDQSSDERFCVFTDPKYGIRALARTLLTYYNKYHLNTVGLIINRWAPPNELTPDGGQSQTAPYITAVAKELGVAADTPLNVDSVAVMLPLVRAIIRHENASVPYTEDQLLEGLHLAGVADAEPPASQTPVNTAHIRVASPPPVPVAPTRDKIVVGASLSGLAPVIMACGTFFFKKWFGMDDATAYNTTIAVAMILAGGGSSLALTGRGQAEIKPLK